LTPFDVCGIHASHIKAVARRDGDGEVAMTDPAGDPDELAFLAAYDASQYPHPSVAVDVVLLTVAADRLRTLLVRRMVRPQQGAWALPGTFVRMDESVDAAARRALAAKAGLGDVFVEQLYTFGEPGRDPRTRVISIAYYALVEATRLEGAAAGGSGERCLADVALAGDAAGAAAVDDAGRPLALAFDHAAILATAVRRIRGKLGYTTIGFELLPETFTLLDLRRIHEAILGRALNKDSFRRTVLDRGLVEPTGDLARGLGHRPPALYRFAPAEDAPDEG
jgi:8-oxo-dGTP diphosphatase